MAKRHRIQKDERNGNYFVRIQVTGTRKYFNLGPRLKRARRELARIERQLRRGELDFNATDGSGSPGVTVGAAQPSARHDEAGSSLTVRELAELHLNWLKVNRAPGTYALYEDFHKAFVGFVGDKKVSEITRLVMEEYYAWAKENRGRSANGGNVFLRHAKSLFLWAEEMDICPCPVKKFPKITETPPETKRFTDQEIAKLLSTAPPEYSDFRDMIVFGLHTGLRPQELRQLEASQILSDGDGRYSVVIQQHKTARMAHEPKPRSVPLTPQATEIALRQIAAHPKAKLVFLN
ncbi:MAG: phage integrase SAM-like domain-containing protein, partial [Kiritimatiellae bacterium]|nr:phage integrase SAM-like domain-containing protein [Kiritimatiellia bacterium]